MVTDHHSGKLLGEYVERLRRILLTFSLGSSAIMATKFSLENQRAKYFMGEGE